MISIFLAGALREHARVQSWAAKLNERGFIIHDRWFDKAHESTGDDASYSREDQATFARAHEYAIRRCRIFWLLWPEQPSVESLYQLGYAKCQRWHVSERLPLHIIVSGKGCSGTRYTASADFREEVDSLGFHAVCNFAQRVIAREAV